MRLLATVRSLVLVAFLANACAARDATAREAHQRQGQPVGAGTQIRRTSRPLICVDPGHPSEIGRGASGRCVPEMDAVWAIAIDLAGRLRRSGVSVVLTKARRTQMVTNRDRASVANRAGADLMLRLHMDASSDRGMAVVYPADEGIVGTVRGPSAEVRWRSHAAAKAFHASVTRDLRGIVRDRGLWTDRRTSVGARYGALIGSIHSRVPSVLVEILTVTNQDDERLYLNRTTRSLIVGALHRASLCALAAARDSAARPSAHTSGPRTIDRLFSLPVVPVRTRGP